MSHIPIHTADEMAEAHRRFAADLYRAVAAERERCAKIAEEAWGVVPADEETGIAIMPAGARYIAARIRSGE